MKYFKVETIEVCYPRPKPACQHTYYFRVKSEKDLPPFEDEYVRLEIDRDEYYKNALFTNKTMKNIVARSRQ